MAGSIPTNVVSLADYEAAARPIIGENAWAYIAGGGADEITLRANREAFDHIRLHGRVLRDMSHADTRVEILGTRMPYPILLAPVAFQRLVHPRGELEAALGAAALGATMVVSTQASTRIEDIARDAQAPLWFQLYVQPDRSATLALAERAAAAGYRALVVTVDAPVNGMRNREQRAGFRMPPDIRAVNLDDVAPAPQAAPGGSPVFGGLLEAAATWADIEQLAARTPLPVLLKGIMSPHDAQRALECGARGVVVSNHGGRTLDTLPATIEVLPAIAARVAGRITVLLDGGIRRGTDVLKALALGADAVMIGRPAMHGLAVGGASGVAHVLSLLRAEFEIAMALTGCARIAEIDRDAIWNSADHAQ